MSGWRYVVSKEVVKGETLFQIREDYGEYGYTVDAIAPSGETRQELIRDLQMMLNDALEGGVLDLTEGDENGL